MKIHQRGIQPPTPKKLSLHLSRMQILGLCQAEEYGWHLTFVRRSPFNPIVPVIMGPDDEQVGVLRKDGTVNIHPDINLR